MQAPCSISTSRGVRPEIGNSIPPHLIDHFQIRYKLIAFSPKSSISAGKLVDKLLGWKLVSEVKIKCFALSHRGGKLRREWAYTISTQTSRRSSDQVIEYIAYTCMECGDSGCTMARMCMCVQYPMIRVANNYKLTVLLIDWFVFLTASKPFVFS